MYQAVVRPHGIPQEWVFNILFGKTDEERTIELSLQLFEMGVSYFTVTHYSEIISNVVMIAIEDINLN
jgi:hypothetical protein